MGLRTLESRFDCLWNSLLLASMSGSLVAAVGAYLLPDSFFPDGAKMREGMIAASAFLFALTCFYLVATGEAKETYRRLKDSLQRCRKRRHPQTEEECAYAEARSCVLPDLPPALLRERLNAWCKPVEVDDLWFDTAEEWVGGRNGEKHRAYIDAAFAGEDYVLTLTLDSAENDFSHAEQKRLIPAELRPVWKEMLLPWEPMDCPVNALIIRRGGETRLYPDALHGRLQEQMFSGLFR